MSTKSKFKSGAASFYIIAFSTLILLTIAMSFTAVILSQVTRTSNSDLAQSAYDSAMAGVEDAKLAYYNYRDCMDKDIASVGGIACSDIKKWAENSDDCDSVAKILGRASGDEGVAIQETIENGNNMQQAYTCTMIKTTLPGYEATLSSTTPVRVIKAKFDNIPASAIQEVEISWYSDRNASENGFSYSNLTSSGVKFPTDTFANRAKPPTISVAMIQTAENFTLSQFEQSVGSETNRGMVYLVPTNNAATASGYLESNYVGAYNSSSNMNIIGSGDLVKSNNKRVQNLPYGVYCPSGSNRGYYCTALLKLPNPVGGVRSNDTFMFVVALPYGQPVTDIAMKFYCSDTNASCEDTEIERVVDAADPGVISKKSANMKGVQIEVDSTGRANDLYRRVQVKMDVDASSGGSSSLSSILGPLELTGVGGDGGATDEGYTSGALQKPIRVTCEPGPWGNGHGCN